MSDQPPPADPKNKPGWMDRLADQSTGLPADQPSRKEPADTGTNPWRLAGVGIQFAGTVAIFALIGYWLDHRFGWTPWATVALAMVAVVGNTYLLIKEAIKLNR